MRGELPCLIVWFVLRWQNYFLNMIRPEFAVVTAVAKIDQARANQAEVTPQEV